MKPVMEPSVSLRTLEGVRKALCSGPDEAPGTAREAPEDVDVAEAAASQRRGREVVRGKMAKIEARPAPKHAPWRPRERRMGVRRCGRRMDEGLAKRRGKGRVEGRSNIAEIVLRPRYYRVVLYLFGKCLLRGIVERVKVSKLELYDGDIDRRHSRLDEDSTNDIPGLCG